MTTNELTEFFKILKKNGISKGDAANTMGFKPSYLSNILSGKKPVSRQFLSQIEYCYSEYIPKTTYMHNKILAKNLARARMMLSLSRQETIEIFQYENPDEMYEIERGNIEAPNHVIENCYNELIKYNFIDSEFDLDKKYLDPNDEEDFKSNKKESTNVDASGH